MILLSTYKELLAHFDRDNINKEQFLIEHLLDVANMAKQTGSKINIGAMCELIGLLHDLGKCSKSFQRYIKGQYKGRVNHSSAGGVLIGYLKKHVEQKHDVDSILRSNGCKPRVWTIYKEMLQYPILAHHGLYDIIDADSNYRTNIRLGYVTDDTYNLDKEYLPFFHYLNSEYELLNNKSIYDLYLNGFLEYIKIYKKLRGMAASIIGENKTKRKALNFYYGAFVRLLLSILKDADIYSASNYFKIDKDKTYSSNQMNDIWNQMSDSIEDIYSKFRNKENKTQLDIVRTELADTLYSFAGLYDKGVYKLNMPVGAGKTYAALRYSIANAKKFIKSRIFYCTAFLSVLEQNANAIKEVIGDCYVLEHHSNMIEDIDEEVKDVDEEYELYIYLKDSWESPAILTTIVQLSNTLFKGKAANLRRFCKLIDSVIIIDEIQSLPIKAIYNFNLMTNFLAQIMNCNILHCTATQPELDSKQALKYPCVYGQDGQHTSLITTTPTSVVFDRVEYYSLLGEDLHTKLDTVNLIQHIKKELKEEMSALIVLNTKSAVSMLYNGLLGEEMLNSDHYEIIYLTTNQCPFHRLQIISNMKIHLRELREGRSQKKIICVSTKLVEAGVDIDFDVVYRSLAGIDSVIQCGGRCNREGKRDYKGKLFIFEYSDENLRYLPDLAKQRRAGRTALRMLAGQATDGNSLDIDKACKYYFNKLYLNDEMQGKNLDFPIKDNDTILDLLTTNPLGLGNYQNKHGKRPTFYLRQGFKTASKNFNLIDEDSISVIVEYQNIDLLNALYEAIEKKDYPLIKMLLRKLQPYTINIRRIADYGKYITKLLGGEILILSSEAYDAKIGLYKGELELLAF